MKKIILLILAVCLTLVPAIAFSQPEVKSATYTITQVDRYSMQVVRIAGRSITVDIDEVGRRRFQVPRDFVFSIDGQDQRLNQLRPGQRLNAYITHTETGELMLVEHTQAPGGEVVESVSEEDIAPELALEEAVEEAMPAALPTTASLVPALGLAGSILTLLGLGLGLLRRI